MGNYAVQPGRRFSLAQEGVSVLYQLPTGAMQLLTAAQVACLDQVGGGRLVSDPGASVPGSNNQVSVSLWILFPEFRDIYAMHLQAGSHQYQGFSSPYLPIGVTNGLASTSIDTTNGLDGTWLQGKFAGLAPEAWIDSINASGPNPDGSTYVGTTLTGTINCLEFPTMPDYRASITPLVGVTQGIKGLRLDMLTITTGYVFTLGTLHLYGRISPNQNPTCLVPWHPTLSQPITQADLDLGDMPVGGSATKQLRFHNYDTTKIAHSVTVSVVPPNQINSTVNLTDSLVANDQLAPTHPQVDSVNQAFDACFVAEDLEVSKSVITNVPLPGETVGDSANGSDSLSVGFVAPTPTSTTPHVGDSAQAVETFNVLSTNLPGAQVSTDNVNFSNSVNVGDIAAGANSAIVYVRRAIPPTANLGADTTEVDAAVTGGWS